MNNAHVRFLPKGAECDAASVSFDPTIRRTDIGLRVLICSISLGFTYLYNGRKYERQRAVCVRKKTKTRNSALLTVTARKSRVKVRSHQMRCGAALHGAARHVALFSSQHTAIRRTATRRIRCEHPLGHRVRQRR